MFHYLIEPIPEYVFKGLEFRKAQKEKKSEIISALRSALRTTRKHIADNRSAEFGDENFSDKDSMELSDRWSNVAMLIRPYSTELANRFEQKSDYWINPYGFRKEIQNSERRFDFRFRLDEVEKELLKLEAAY